MNKEREELKQIIRKHIDRETRATMEFTQEQVIDVTIDIVVEYVRWVLDQKLRDPGRKFQYKKG